MNIGNVKHNGSVDRGAERGARTDGKRATSSAGSAADRAAISADGQKAAAAFERRVVAARAEDEVRDDRVARAMKKLLGGDLDRAEVVQDTAERVLGQDFRTV